MNNKHLSSYLVAAFIGGGLGYLIADAVVEALIDRMYEDSVCQDAFWSNESVYNGPDSFDNGPDEKNEPNIIDKVNPIETKNEKKKTDYNTISKKPSLKDVVKSYATEDEDIPDPYDGAYFEIITDEQWEEETSNYEKFEVTYYSVDGKFVVKNDEESSSDADVVEQPEALFGPNIHLHFGDGSDDPDVVYVRNCYISDDYKITRVDEAYNSVVEEPKKPPKKARVKKDKIEPETDDTPKASIIEQRRRQRTVK